MNRRDFIHYPQAGWESNLPTTQVCMQVDAPACLALIEKTMMSGWLKD